MRRVCVVSDHPDLSTGFARVSDLIARSLGAQAERVAFLARTYGGGSTMNPPPFEILPIGADYMEPMDPALMEAAFSQMLQGLGDDIRLPVIGVANVTLQRDLMEFLVAAGLRNRVLFISYLPIDFGPLPDDHLSLTREADFVVPYSRFGEGVLLARCGGVAGLTKKVLSPIPHAVDTEVFRPPEPEVRERTRHDVFGAGEKDLVLGFFSRNSVRKRVDLALWIFRLWSTASFVQCRTCDAVTAFEPDPVTMHIRPPIRCRRCSGTELERPRQVRTGRFYLHTELLTPNERRAYMGFDLPRLSSLLGIHDRVIFEPSLAPGIGLQNEELARRMGACDVHLLPFMGGGWELTILETAACGVSNIVTEFATPPEYAQPFSELIPPSEHLLRPYGVAGVMDVHEGVAALNRLAESPETRAAMGRAGVEVAREHSQEKVGERWCRLLRTLPATA